ncbi:hypothetical protein ANN_10329 [Periplaneta americana]|uniref:Uncharacterized protein n=1 Tax=Periplaneta americana TaxID=6978 RepID=A0ABQ8TNQ3_PERAM|nr:hypothetical protein ANN_10329 [Periplaneta americana]
MDVTSIILCSRYEAMEAAGEVLYGRDLENEYRHFFPDGVQEENEDNHQILESIELLNRESALVSQMMDILNKEIKHVSSGMHQLERKEKEALYNLLAKGQSCMKLDSKVCAAREQLLKLMGDLKQQKSTAQMLGQMPLEAYQKRCQEFVCSIKMIMRHYLEWNKFFVGDCEDDIIEELEHSVVEMKVENMYLSAILKGKKRAIEELQNIEASITSVSPSDIRCQTLFLEERVKVAKMQISLMFENEVLPAAEMAVKLSMLPLRKHRQEYEASKQQTMLTQLEDLNRCLTAGLCNSELLLLLLVTERQDIADKAEVLHFCCQDISEEHSEFLKRMKVMQKLKEKQDRVSAMDRPLVHCLVQLLEDKHSFTTSTDLQELKLRFQKLNQAVKAEEDKFLEISCHKQKRILLPNINAISLAEEYFCPGLSKKPLSFQMEISDHSNKLEQLIKAFEEHIKEIRHKFEKKQIFFLEKPFHAQQRLLWVYFLRDPKTFSTIVQCVQDLAERKMEQKKQQMHKRRRQTNFFPRTLQN